MNTQVIAGIIGVLAKADADTLEFLEQTAAQGVAVPDPFGNWSRPEVQKALNVFRGLTSLSPELEAILAPA